MTLLVIIASAITMGQAEGVTVKPSDITEKSDSFVINTRFFDTEDVVKMLIPARDNSRIRWFDASGTEVMDVVVEYSGGVYSVWDEQADNVLEPELETTRVADVREYVVQRVDKL